MTNPDKTPIEMLQEWIREGLFEPQPYDLRDTGAVKRAATLPDIAQGVLAMASSPRATLRYYNVADLGTLDIGDRRSSRSHPQAAEILLLTIEENVFLEKFDNPSLGTEVFGYFADEMAVEGIILSKVRQHNGSLAVIIDLAIESHQYRKWSGAGEEYSTFYLGDGFGLVGTNSLGHTSNGFCIYEWRKESLRWTIPELLRVACGEPMNNPPNLRVARNEHHEVRWALWREGEKYFTDHLPLLGPFLEYLATLPLMEEPED